MILSEHHNWIFVCFVKGSHGHLLGRCLSTSPDAVWYDNPINGEHPWCWNHFPVEVGIGCSPGHYLKWFKAGQVPAFGFYEEWFEGGDFNQQWLTDILDNNKLIYTAHDSPAYLKEHFPNCKIIMIDIADSDWPNCVRNQVEKTGSYPAIGVNSSPEKLLWHSATQQNTVRDWEKYSNNLTDREWIDWTEKTMRQEMEVLRSQSHLVDYVFSSADRTNVDAILTAHKELGLAYDKDLIQKVLDAFNL